MFSGFTPSCIQIKLSTLLGVANGLETFKNGSRKNFVEVMGLAAWFFERFCNFCTPHSLNCFTKLPCSLDLTNIKSQKVSCSQIKIIVSFRIYHSQGSQLTFMCISTVRSAILSSWCIVALWGARMILDMLARSKE